MNTFTRAVAGLTAASVMAMAVPALADPAPTITPLKQGQVAPYAGVLLSVPAVAQVIAQQDTDKAAIMLAVQNQATVDADKQSYALASAATTCAADKSIITAQVTDLQKQNQVLVTELKRATGGLSTPVWVGIGVVGGIAVTLVTALAINKL